MIVGRSKLERLVALSRIADPIVCIDHRDQLDPLSEAFANAGLRVRVLIEVDIGLGRVGAIPGPAVLELAHRADQAPGIVFAGVMGYEGHLLTVQDPEEKAHKIDESLGLLVEAKELIERHGIACPIVSCAGTGSFEHAVRTRGITEIQAGGAVFMDAFYRRQCRVSELEYALFVVTTVVSRPASDRAVIDAGRKTLSMEIEMPLVTGRDDVRVKGLSAEHGTLELDDSARSLRIGDRLLLIPGYGDLTTAMHDELYGFRAGKLETIWPIEARGKIR